MDDRRKAFNDAIKGVPVHKVEIAFSGLTRGIDWRRAGVPCMREAFVGDGVFPSAAKVTVAQLREAMDKVRP